jgi:hypothetical protein
MPGERSNATSLHCVEMAVTSMRNSSRWKVGRRLVSADENLKAIPEVSGRSEFPRSATVWRSVSSLTNGQTDLTLSDHHKRAQQSLAADGAVAFFSTNFFPSA